MTTIDSPDPDSQADEEILACLQLESLRSFFLFAGAGSGKTRSLVTVLRGVREASGKRLRVHSQKIGVITYTNAACDEIKQRLDYDPLITVETIHSFVWSLIRGFQSDIRRWISENLRSEVAELQLAQEKGRAGSKAATERARKIESKRRRLANLPSIRKFVYSPTGDNRTRDALNHAEVIKMGATFLVTKPLMQSVLINQFPILLVDESQDTNASLMEAFLAVQVKHQQAFALGLFGDTMQRIYADGKPDLGRNLPSDWATPAKTMNHRSPRRVVELINRIRLAVDTQQQKPRPDAEEGFVRLFLLPSSTGDKARAENLIKQRMVEITGDPLWSGGDEAVKSLILEHHMAARRLGFLPMFAPLYTVRDGALRTPLLEGSVAGLRFFSDLVLPLVNAQARGDQFAVARIVRTQSPLFSQAALKESGRAQVAQVRGAREAIERLMTLWEGGGDPSFIDVLRCVAETRLFEVPESLQPLALPIATAQPTNGQDVFTYEDADEILQAWDEALKTPFSQIRSYIAYVSGTAPFGTHQGVKGLEFPRVLVVMDDEEARGFMFKYERLFGAEAGSSRDRDRERSGEESSIDRTRRLLYVTCSRSKKSLALVAYSGSPHSVRAHVIREGWMMEGEIEVIA